jgi:carboxypeptidase PM20D1
VYRAISDGVVNFTPVVDSKGYHGIDERLPIKDYQKAISFYTLILKEAQQ